MRGTVVKRLRKISIQTKIPYDILKEAYKKKIVKIKKFTKIKSVAMRSLPSAAD